MQPLTTPHEQMVSRVAAALGPEIASQIAFVGGCATALLVTDEAVKGAVRFTDDVDVIVHVLGMGQWYQLEAKLSKRGFLPPLENDDSVICRKRLRDDQPHELIVDFMPDDQQILGFSNRWYADALAAAVEHQLSDGSKVRVVTAPYFLATKLEAYKGRGNNDPIGSRDVEDILNLVEGRPSLLEELRVAPPDLQRGVGEEVAGLLKTRDFDYAVGSACNGNAARERIMFERLEALAALASAAA